MPTTPRSLGYRMPAEWEPHEATWLAWPHNPRTWPGRVENVEAIYAQMIEALARDERVDLLVKDDRTEARARELVGDVSNVVFHRVHTFDAWIRDYGPNFLTRETEGNVDLAYNRWQFHAWGNAYEPLLRDDGIPDRLPAIRHLSRFAPEFVLEGGAIDVNGAGSVLTTQRCLLDSGRNPTLARRDVEEVLRDHLGVSQVLWLLDGVEGTDTDGHIDNVARFTDPHTIVAAVEPDPADAHHERLAANMRMLRRMRDAEGRPFRIAELPMPGRLDAGDGRLPASYANFYIANRVVLLPTFGHPNDAKAGSILAALFPGRRVIPVPCEDVVWGMGTIHCLTQQQPTTIPPSFA